MKIVARLTSKGQVTVPKTVRQTLGIVQGDGVEFTVDKSRVSLRGLKPARSSSGVLLRFLPARWVAPTVKEMDLGIAQHVARRNRLR
jgi:antitoxin PrlF